MSYGIGIVGLRKGKDEFRAAVVMQRVVLARFSPASARQCSVWFCRGIAR